jgi:hypothetical protein
MKSHETSSGEVRSSVIIWGNADMAQTEHFGIK